MKPDESIDTVQDSIDTVLNALGTSEPPQGYEARIHTALLNAASIQARHPRSTSYFQTRHPERSAAKSKDLLVSLRPWMSWAAACAVALVLGITVRSYLHHDTARSTSTAAVTERTSPSHPQQNSKPMLQRLKADASPTKVPTKHILREQPSQAEPAGVRRIEVALETHDYIPPPPLPITEEERLVIRMARSNDAQQLAEYTPDARARRLHEDAQEYREHFAAKPLEGQPIYVQPMYHQQIPQQNSGGTQ